MCRGNETELTVNLRMVHTACSLFLALVGTFGNGLSVILICRAQMLRAAPTMMLIIDLCVANMVSTVVIMPVIAGTSFYNHWPLDDIFCQIFAYIMYAGLTSECFILMNITIGQYLVIVHRMSNGIILHHHRFLRISALLALPWVISMCVYIIPLTKVWDMFGYDPKKGYCSIISKEERFGLLTVGAITIIATMTAITFYCYIAIYVVHYTSQKKVTPSMNITTARSINNARNSQIIKMIMAILLNYLLTYLPYLVTSIADPCLKHTSSTLYTIIVYISWSHTATNPVIYALLNTRINSMCCQLIVFWRPRGVTKVASTKLMNGIEERNNEINSIT